MQLGRVADLGIDNAIGGEVDRALARNAAQRLLGLGHPDRVLEGLEVALERAGVRRIGKPLREGVGILRREAGVAELIREVEHRLGSQAAVEVVVQQHLGRAHDEISRDW